MKRVLILGRFQPPHAGHLAVIEEASKGCDELIVAIGSAQASYTSKNPFTAGERIEMLGAALRARRVSNTLLVPILDLNRHAEWVAYVASLVPPFDEVVSNNPLTRALFEAAGYKVRDAPWHRKRQCSGTKIRKRIRAGKDLGDLVDASTEAILKRLNATQRLVRVEEDAH